MKKKLILFGTGSFADVAKCYFNEDSEYEVVAFCADKEYCDSKHYNGLPLIPFENIENIYPPTSCEMHITIGYSKLNFNRFEAYKKAKSKGYKLASYIHSNIKIWDNNIFGDNIFIFENNTIQPFVKFQSNIVLWSGNHIGHNTKIAKHVYLSSHVVISGNCNLGERSFFGVNSTIKDFTNIANDCFIGMGSIVTKDLKAFSVVLPNKSNIYEKDSREANIIKRKYFK